MIKAIIRTIIEYREDRKIAKFIKGRSGLRWGYRGYIKN